MLSQRFDCVPGVDAFEIYRSLRIVNPSPYMYFLRFGLDGEGKKSKTREAHIVGSSPELLVRVHNGTVEYRPIAGSRPRGADEVQDRALEADLRADAKEVSEHIMLVDLGRNDVGRVSEFGSVKVKDLMFVERYSHIMHLVSSLEGKLRAGLAPIDAFRACFPAGTLNGGAPKIRAMEIIEELDAGHAAESTAALFSTPTSVATSTPASRFAHSLWMARKATSRPAQASSRIQSRRKSTKSAGIKPRLSCVRLSEREAHKA